MFKKMIFVVFWKYKWWCHYSS